MTHFSTHFDAKLRTSIVTQVDANFGPQFKLQFGTQIRNQTRNQIRNQNSSNQFGIIAEVSSLVLTTLKPLSEFLGFLTLPTFFVSLVSLVSFVSFVSFLSLVFFGIPRANAAGSPKNIIEKASENSADQNLEITIRKMTLQEKVGQLFCIGFPQTEITSELKTYIKEFKPGAFVIFKRNIESLLQISRLNRELRELSSNDFPPLIAVDQEGGAVTRIATNPPLPSPLSVGQTRSPELAEEFGAESGKILKSLGFNMNLAPVLDVADPSHASFIGVRSFGGEPNLVSEIGGSVARGLLNNYILPTAKHFPGTGATTFDPHKFVISKNAGKGQIEQDLKSFQKFINLEKPRAIMLSHFKYPAIDDSGLPATFSPKIIHDVLRIHLKFNGLIITDDLQMSSAKIYHKPEDAALASLKAGADLVMLTWSFKDQKASMKRVLAAVQSGELSTADLNDKLRRILRAKLFLKIGDDLEGRKIASSHSAITSKPLSDLNWRILSNNLKQQLESNSLALSPLAEASGEPTKGLCVFSSYSSFNIGFAKSVHENVRYFNLIDHGAKKLAQTIASRKCQVSLIAILGEKTARQVEDLPNKLKENVVLVNMAGPFVIKHPESFVRVLNLYFPHFGAGEIVGQHIKDILNLRNYTSTLNWK